MFRIKGTIPYYSSIKNVKDQAIPSYITINIKGKEPVSYDEPPVDFQNKRTLSPIINHSTGL